MSSSQIYFCQHLIVERRRVFILNSTVQETASKSCLSKSSSIQRSHIKNIIVLNGNTKHTTCRLNFKTSSGEEGDGSEIIVELDGKQQQYTIHLI